LLPLLKLKSARQGLLTDPNKKGLISAWSNWFAWGYDARLSIKVAIPGKKTARVEDDSVEKDAVVCLALAAISI